ncbi:hypothetical protein BJY21_004437 [Kineosphaera limosa]|uniref:Glyoxalase-like domain-containing protein n=1 Tax=Kineosphaera limosa NBRC 100340 TaxID=1184609 RepID=K6XBM2_9MICO|nr:VOC family protein [Kineosphaera limosa]NYE03253.1 hypothetical protein [Kineosphaera limosa]GAB96224.1 hypothetical protein KILIM_033_00440 [Kineosphaera limosa NBRC 100340]
MSRTIQITFDAADPEGLSRFWAQALGYRHPPPPGRELAEGEDPFDAWRAFLAENDVPEDQWNSASAAEDPDGVGPRLFFQRVADGKSSKNRVHIDVRVAPELVGDERMGALEGECDRLVALGATRVQRFEPAPPTSNGFIVMQDPEGNEFCLD